MEPPYTFENYTVNVIPCKAVLAAAMHHGPYDIDDENLFFRAKKL